MQVIPVVDLIDGVVVRAKLGDRGAYRPIETPLSPTAEPIDVVRGLLNLHPSRTLYVADLDAIRGRGDNFAALAALRGDFPALTFWVDNGAADTASVAATRAFGVPVLGSESQRDLALMRQTPDAILSLDFRGDSFQGPADLSANPEVWPQRVIVMTLGRVGSGAGPDLERFAAVRALAGARALFAAGGVRDAGDLVALERAGAAGVLVATALHDGRLAGANLG